MKEIVLKRNNELTLEPLMKKFLNYIDVSDNTMKTYNVGLVQFCYYLKDNNIKEPTREDIINFREYLRETHKPNTVNAYLIAIRNFYSWLEYEDISKDISKKIKGIKLERHHLKRGLSPEEIKKIIDVCKDTREELIIKLAITCALRINEIRNIRIEDFYDDKGVVMLKVLGKARDGLKQDSVKIDDRIFELIKQYCKEYNVKDYLFYSTSPNNYGNMMTTTSLRKIINNLYKRAGLDMEKLSPHSTRHTSVELALESGIPIQEVSEFVRHKSINTTMVYAKELNQRNSQIANTLGDFVF
ncbi:MAG: tyrosine-type recombinase/integrase [Candidatus Gastranaerophilales bacterium]|nr:tyrosine-type recombinase/integrase [Candidatus Gastranaerophilales bacterium]